MYSMVVSLKPPFLALARGVRTARVMTMSSAFLEVLRVAASGQRPSQKSKWREGHVKAHGTTHIWDSPLPGARCLRMEPSLSTAIVRVLNPVWVIRN